MSGDEVQEVPVPKKKLSPQDKQREHLAKVHRTMIACGMGILTGVISFFAIDRSNITGFTSYTTLALLIMVAGIVVQKHIFLIARMAPVPLNGKDWFFQGFMTFAFWFVTWTILLTAT
jgi:hypothetical protein